MDAQLLLLDGVTGAVHPCRPGALLVIGRADASPAPHVPCGDPATLPRHCELHVGPDALSVVDRSGGATFVNGVPVAGSALAAPGDRIQLGASRYPFAVVSGDAARVPPGQTAGTTAPPPPATPRPGLAPEGRAARDAAPVPPLLDGRFAIQGEVARGGMGVVYAGLDQATGARVAVKVLRNAARARPQDVERFRREAALGERLGQHPGIVAVRASGSLPSGVLYYVMDYVSGEPLDVVVDRVERGRAVELVRDVARVVAFAHEHGVIHRDLKPHNVIVTADGGVRLTDFGIAKAVDAVQGLTATGAVMGTPTYMPPEQVRDSKRVDPRSDVYGLSGILYFALTGRAPLELGDGNLRQALKRVLENDIVSPAELDPTIDPALDAICRRALAGDPADRPPSAAAFADELDAWLAGDRTVRPYTGAPARRGTSPTRDEGGDEEEDEPVPGLALALTLALGLVVLAAAVIAVKLLR